VSQTDSKYSDIECLFKSLTRKGSSDQCERTQVDLALELLLHGYYEPCIFLIGVKKTRSRRSTRERNKMKTHRDEDAQDKHEGWSKRTCNPKIKIHEFGQRSLTTNSCNHEAFARTEALDTSSGETYVGTRGTKGNGSTGDQ
jgi:hypothetical protein